MTQTEIRLYLERLRRSIAECDDDEEREALKRELELSEYQSDR
jgi:hypothetical protein